MRDGPERLARDTIYDSTTWPPNILRYVVRCQYRNISGLENWLVSTLGAAPGSSNRLFILATNNSSLDEAAVHTALGGPAQLPLSLVQANMDTIRKQLTKYFMVQRISIQIESLQGSTSVSSPSPIDNHLGVTLP
jgi:hypothetical protein